MLLFLTSQPLLLSSYLFFYLLGHLLALRFLRKLEETQQNVVGLQILLLSAIAYLYRDKYQNDARAQLLLLMLICLKSFLSGYLNGLLQYIRFSLVVIHFNVAYVMAILIAGQFLVHQYFFRAYSLAPLLFIEQILILVSCLNKNQVLPPVLEQISDLEIENYVKYIERCTAEESILNYEE